MLGGRLFRILLLLFCPGLMRHSLRGSLGAEGPSGLDPWIGAGRVSIGPDCRIPLCEFKALRPTPRDSLR